MKITAGKFKKMTIASVSDERTRYTPAIVREALFNIVEVSGENMLELFGGSGIITAEAISRLVENVTVVEISRSSCTTIRKNLEKLGHSFHLLNLDFRIAIRRLSNNGEKFDLIFADPPFGTGLLMETFKELDAHSELLNLNGLVVIESFEKELPPENGVKLKLKVRKAYGDVILNFYQTDLSDKDEDEKTED